MVNSQSLGWEDNSVHDKQGDSQMHHIQECDISVKTVVRAGNIVVLNEKNPHIRNIRDGTAIKLDVSEHWSVHTGYVDLSR